MEARGGQKISPNTSVEDNPEKHILHIQSNNTSPSS